MIKLTVRQLRNLLVIATTLLLLCLLLYPLGYDQSTFIVGGDYVLHGGGIPYRDFFDVKPPLIFYIYALALALFGHHAWSIRVLEVVYVAASLYYFFRIQLRSGIPELRALLSIFITSIGCVALGFSQSAQTETFAILPLLVLLDTSLRVKDLTSTTWVAVAAGLALSALFFLKFTFIAAYGAVILFLLTSDIAARKKGLRLVALSLSVFFISIGLFFIFLTSIGGAQGFRESLEFVSHYGSLGSKLSASTIKTGYYVEFPHNLIDCLTLSSFVAGVAGIAWWLRRLVVRTEDVTQTRFYTATALQFFFGMIGLVFEGKYFRYHFVRLYWAFAPFVALGCSLSWRWFKQLWSHQIASPISQFSFKALLVVAAAILLFFSPMMHIVSQPLYWVSSYAMNRNIPEAITSRDTNYWYTDMVRASNILKARMKPADQIFLWGNHCNIYFLADRRPTTPSIINSPFVAPFTPPRWKVLLLESLARSNPRFFVIETLDRLEMTTGTNKDSYQLLQDWADLNSYLESHYQFTDRTNHFLIFERRS